MTKKPITLGELNTTAGKINTRVGQVCTKVDKLSAKVSELSIKADELQHAIMRRDREIAAIGELLLPQDQKLTDLMARIAEKLALEEPRHRPLT
jgi:peptidoglycan hydrolase CwlO-like protein